MLSSYKVMRFQTLKKRPNYHANMEGFRRDSHICYITLPLGHYVARHYPGKMKKCLDIAQEGGFQPSFDSHFEVHVVAFETTFSNSNFCLCHSYSYIATEFRFQI